MKLDRSVSKRIVEIVNGCLDIYDPYFSDGDDYFFKLLEELDLVFKPGDASQATLVENCPKSNNIARDPTFTKNEDVV